MTEQEKRERFFAKTKRVATSATVEYQAFLWGIEFAEDVVQKQLAEREAECLKLRELLPKRIPNGFISFGKYCSEANSKFAPASDPMSKFKHKWFLDCEEALSTSPSTTYLEQWERDHFEFVQICEVYTEHNGKMLYARKD